MCLASNWYLQINENGVISFNNSYNVRTPSSLPLFGGQAIIAPYWADVDLRGTGQVFYRQTTDPSLLARATSEIRAAFSDSQNVTITNLLVATWSEVGYFFRNTDKVTMVYCTLHYWKMLVMFFLSVIVMKSDKLVKYSNGALTVSHWNILNTPIICILLLPF